MLNTNKNWRITIIKTVLATINSGLISTGLVSCLNPVQQPLAPSQPTIQPNQQPNQPDRQDKDDDKKGDRDDDKDDKD